MPISWRRRRACGCSLSVVPSPLRQGDRPSFYRPRRGRFTGVPHYFPTCGGMASSAAELTAVLANPASVKASWCTLCSYRSGFEGGVVVVGRPAVAVARFEGAVDGSPYVAQWWSWRRLVPVCSNSTGDVVTVPSVELQWLGWPHRADSDGDDRLCRPDVTAWPCVVTEKAFEGAAGPPSRARRVSRTGVGDAVSWG
jgi:hypothetical protein